MIRTRWAHGVATLRREVDRLIPNLKELRAQEERLRKAMPGRTSELGVSQAFEFGQRSNADRTRIEKIRNDIQKLATRLDVTLGRPPPLKPQPDTDSERS
ncbi:hypothetical protein NM688_g7950 [Phlebia brevispora]|uniref:Uncharacterized protein n=1 Tax=Phlebia brevispora TaxID=194682 RepID=A0ACC1RZF6_9APHY|nr:hypothetical protein NM688_g7950 [Phlebia brevispora]